jgi:uncharacterized protein (TIGR00369 family)
MPKLYDLFRERVAAGGGLGVANTLRFTLEHFEPGRARVRMNVRPEFFNPMATLHGGVYCDLADMAMGIAFFCALDDDEAMTTLELKINFLRPSTGGVLFADANVVHRGRTTGLVECDIRDEGQRLVARASSSCYVLTGEKAAGAFRAMADWR